MHFYILNLSGRKARRLADNASVDISTRKSWKITIMIVTFLVITFMDDLRHIVVFSQIHFLNLLFRLILGGFFEYIILLIIANIFINFLWISGDQSN